MKLASSGVGRISTTVLLLALASRALAQKATLRRQVLDESDGAVPEARVVVTAVAALERTATTDARGLIGRQPEHVVLTIGSVRIDLKLALAISATERRFDLIVGMSVRSQLNHTNPGLIIGDITTPLFGFSNQTNVVPNAEGFSESANNRRVELQMRLTF